MASRAPKPNAGVKAVRIDSEGSNVTWNMGFAILGVLTLLMFLRWGMGHVGPEGDRPLLVIATLFGVFMAFNIGGNDVANSFGTSVGAGTLTIKQALLVAAVFEVSGAVLAGGSVTDTVRSGIVDLSGVPLDPRDFMFIMMAALFAAACWLLIATKLGFPVSTTHSIIGGIVGAALTLGFAEGLEAPFSMVQWDGIIKIAISWVLSPVLGGVVAYLLYRWVKSAILQYNDRADEALARLRQARKEHKQRHRMAFSRLTEIQQIAYTGALARDAATVRSEDYEYEDLESDYFRELEELDREAREVDAHRALETWVPVLAAFGAVVITSMLLFKGLSNLDLGLSVLNNLLIMGMVGAAVWMAVVIFVRSMKRKSLQRSTFLVFSWMQVFTAAAFAFSHGSNDIANAIGPFIAIIDVLRSGDIASKAAVPAPVLAAFGIALVVGLWFIGRNVIRTVGTSLTKMHPSSGFSAELSAAVVVMGASVFGLPVSSTHILIGAVLGIGVANHATNWALMRPIGLAWVITLPAAAIMAAGMFLGLQAVF
ncbi:MAG: anion permease [Bowdeniella nasicola]|nr:anion permease [Bowdeniella nasicola]